MPTVFYPETIPSDEGRTLIKAIASGKILDKDELPVNAHALWTVQGFAQSSFIGNPFPSVKGSTLTVNLTADNPDNAKAEPLTEEEASETLAKFVAVHESAAQDQNVFALPIPPIVMIQLALWAARMLEMLWRNKPTE